MNKTYREVSYLHIYKEVIKKTSPGKTITCSMKRPSTRVHQDRPQGLPFPPNVQHRNVPECSTYVSYAGLSGIRFSDKSDIGDSPPLARPRWPRTAISTLFRREKRIRVRIWFTTSEYSSPLFVEINSAIRLLVGWVPRLRSFTNVWRN